MRVPLIIGALLVGVSESLITPLSLKARTTSISCKNPPRSTTSLYASESSSSSSLLVDTRWKLQLDVGLQPGTWMPKRYPGWAESGARLGFDIEVEFTKTPILSVLVDEREKERGGDPLVGRLDETYQLKVISTSSSKSSSKPEESSSAADFKNPTSTFVSENGLETIEFNGIGGWRIERPNNPVRNTNGCLVKPEGILRFYIDCISGAKRRDVEIFKNTRIIFTTGVWDNPSDLDYAKQDYEKVLNEMEILRAKTKDLKQEQQSGFNPIQQVVTFQQMVTNSKEYDELKNYAELYKQQLPPSNAVTNAKTGVQIASDGSIVIQGEQSNWLGSEYLILGKFTTATSSST